MTQSKQELAERNAKIRAEKLRENLARRKQQNRERTSKVRAELEVATGQTGENAEENLLG